MPTKARAPRGKSVLTSDLRPLASGRRSVAIANRHPLLRVNRHAVARVIHLLDSEFPKSKSRIPQALSLSDGENLKSKIPPGELSVTFLTDAALAQLHGQFLNDPTPTDVITFEGDPALGSAGEICVSVDAALRHVGPPLVGEPLRVTARRQAPALQKAFSNELTLYLVHGWLHLAGYDDLVPRKKRAMRRAEARAMRILTLAGAVPRFMLRGAP